MKTTVVLSVLAFVAGVIAQTNLTIATPAQLVTCQPALLSWSGGTPPYYVSVIPGGQTGATALVTFPVQSGTTYTWPEVNVDGSITIEVRDTSGQVQYTSPVNVQTGPDTSCVGQSLSASGSASGSSTPSASGSTPASVTPSGSSPASASPSGSASAASSPSPSPTSSAIGVKAGALSVVFIAGLIGAALF